MDYKPAKIDFTQAQVSKMLKGQPVRLTSSQIGSGSKVMMLHPANHTLLSKAVMSKKGCVLHPSKGEVQATINSTMEGTGFFDTLKKGFNFLKDSGILSSVVDMAVAPATAMAGPTFGKLVAPARNLLKQTTGVGAVRRPRRKKSDNVLIGSSFRLN